MKTKTVLLASVVLAVRLLGADDAKPPRRAPADRPQAALGGAFGGGLGAFEQVLTDEQRQKLREYNQANGTKLRASQQEMMKLRRELQEAVVNGKADESLIKQKTEAIGKLEGEILAGRMSALARVAGTLTQEQKDKIKEMSEQVRAARPGLGAGLRDGDAPRAPREPAAPPPPEK